MRKQKIVKFTLKNMILNEEEEAKTALKTGEINKKPSLTLRPIIKYLYSIGKNKGQIRQDIEEFMSNNFPEYVSSKWNDILDGLVNTYAKDDIKMIKIKNVIVTQKELEYISNLNDIKLEKLAFVILVYYKIKEQMGNKTSSSSWINFNNSEVFRDAKVRLKVIDQSFTLAKLKKTGAIDISRRVGNESIKINYINEESPSAIVIDDFREFVLTYLEWKGESIKRCSECGILFKLKSANSNQKYCNSCGKKIKNSQIKKIKKNKKMESNNER